jgi:hypothetical protein
MAGYSRRIKVSSTTLKYARGEEKISGKDVGKA